MKRIAFLFAVCILTLSGIPLAKAQYFSTDKGQSWGMGLQDARLFIENQGQFKVPSIANLDASVHYAYDAGPTRILFTSKGVIYYFAEKRLKHERDEKEMERERHEKIRSIEDHLEREREENAVVYKRDFVSALWDGANENAEVIATDKAPEYYSYEFYEGGEVKNVNYIYGYKKITYKNLYPNIDVEYVFPQEGGIKYSLILHPGADPSVIKIKYSERPVLKDNGDIHLRTRFGDIVEHAPASFYSGNKFHVASAFLVNGKTASFYLAPYDKTQSLTIDPWVQSPTINNSNGVWECEKDGAGNVYIIGGDSPMKLLKYNAAGTLQWTYVTPYDTANGWLGTFATDNAGNSYVTMGSTARINKVNTSGSSLYNVTGGSNDEYWNISFNCDQTKLVVAGTRLTGLPSITGSGVIFDINTANGAVTAMKTVGYTVPGGFGINNPDEVRAITSSFNARYYYMTLDSIGAIDQNFSACPNQPNLFKTNHTYALGYKCENWRPKGNSGIMAIRANKNFVYTQNGKTVHKRSKATGAIITSATIPGGGSSTSLGFNVPSNSGIDLDSCGNVYVGSGNQVVKYDANLNQLSTAATTFPIYDVAVSYNGNVIVCGATGTSTSTSRTGYVQSFSMGACDPMTLICCDPTVCPAGPFCSTDPTFTLTPVQAGGTWSGAGVNSSGVFNPATAGSGTHAIVYTLPCGKDSVMITVNPCASLSVCANSGSLTVSGGTPSYTWSVYNPGGTTPITTQAQCTACNSSYTWLGGQCLNGFTPVNSCNSPPSWTQVGTGASIPTPTTTPIKVVDAVGNSYTITTIASVPSCSACTTPTVTIASTQSVTCNGTSTGAATLTANPAGTYTATWQPGGLTGLTQSGLAAGVYTVTTTAGGSCSTTTTVNIAAPTALTASITTNTPASCGANNGALTVTASGGTGTYTYTWTPSGGNAATASNLAGGSYTVTVQDANSCSVTATASVTTTTSPTITVNSATVCAGGTATLTANGATTYTWSPGTGLSSTSGSVVTASPGSTTVYTVSGSSGTCTATPGTATVTISASPTITVNSATICAGATTTLTANGATTYTWSPGTGLSSTSGSVVTASPGSTTVYTVSGSGGVCTFSPGTSTVTISPSPTITINNNSLCSSTSVTITASGASTYTWSPATGLNTTNGSSVIANPGATTTYTVIGTDAGGCTDTTSVTVQNSPSLGTTVTSSSVTCNGLANGSATVVPNGGSGPITYSWSPVGGNGPTATNIAAGTYTCVVMDSVGCTGTATVTITQPSTLSVTANSGLVCVGGSYSLTAVAAGGTGPYTYNWNSGASTSNPYVVSPTSSTSYTITIVDANGCTVSDNAIVVGVRPPLQVTANNIYICAGNTGTLSATASGGNGTYSYTWTPGNTTGSTVVVTPSVTTVYTVTVSDGCTSPNGVDTAMVNVTPPPSLPAPVPAQGCAPQCVNFTTPSGLVSWMWDFGDGAISGQNNPSHCYTTAGSFNISLTYTTGTGCASSITYSNVVNIYPVPVANFNPSPDPTDILDPTVNFYNTSINSNSWLWTFGDGSGSSSQQSPSHTYGAPGEYAVMLISTSSNGCKDTVIQYVKVNDIFTFYAPNAFSPNDDNTNPVFLPLGEGWNETTYTLWIYDRWGNLVFKTNDAHKGWDGRYRSKGDGVQEDTYIWKVQLDDIFGKRHDFHGTVHVVK